MVTPPPSAFRLPPSAFRVWLIGNFEPDRQESMQRFSRLLADELARGRDWEPRLIQPEPWFSRVKPSASGLGKWLGYLDKFVVFPRRLRALARSADPNDLFHICDHSNAMYVRSLAARPHLVTCHDLLAVRSALGEIPQNPVRWSGRKLQSMILAGLNQAGAVACVSGATRADLLRLTSLRPAQVRVVYNGLNFPYAPLASGEALRRIRGADAALAAELAAGKPFILHVGGEHWYKNRPGVLRLYAALRRQLSAPPGLVLAGAPFSCAMREFIRAEGLASSVWEVAQPDSPVLQALYSQAALFLFPSLEEGFGWPIIEAQACGCRVATTDKAPMNEIAGDAAVLLDPAAVTDEATNSQLSAAARQLAAALQQDAAATEDSRRRSMANAAKYSTANMIEGYLTAYRELISDGTRSGGPSSRRP